MNLLGLSISIGVAILAFLFYDVYATQDSFHTKRDREFLIESIIDPGNAPEHWGVCPTPMGRAMVRDLPEVEATVSFRVRKASVRVGDNITDEWMTYAEPDFFKLFDFELLEGDPTAFSDPTSIYLTEKTANAYFPGESATGKSLELIIGENKPVEMKVAGVFKEIPTNSSIRFTFLVPYANLQTWFGYDPDDWDGWNSATFILLKEGADVENVRAKLGPYLETQNKANPEWQVDEFYVDPFTEAVFNAPHQRSSFLAGKTLAGVIATTVIGVILLLLSTFNYANNSLVLVSRRFREIGIRKISGSTRGQLIFQFIGESLIFMTVSVLLGLTLTEAFLLPAWNSTIPFANFNILMLANSRGLFFIIGLLFIAGIGTGIYPALVVSRFQPIQIFRGTANRVGYSLSVRIMTGLQFALTFILLFFTAYHQSNGKYLKNIDHGYNTENLLWVTVEKPEVATLIADELKKDPDVVDVKAVQDHVGAGWRLQALMLNDVRHDVAGLGVVPGYLEMLKYRLIEGHFFDPDGPKYGGTDAVINDLLAKELNIKEPIGTRVTLDGKPYNIIGIVESTINNGLMNKRYPAIYTLADEKALSRVVVLTQPRRAPAVADRMREIKAQLLPNLQRNVFFQEANDEWVFRELSSIAKVLNFSSALALLIALMGLFGLISSQLANRERELAVRRVLGAEIRQVVRLITWPFVRLFLISIGIALVPAWFITLTYTKQQYADYGAMSPVIPLLAIILMLALILLTLFSQITAVVSRNPSQVLRDE